MQQPGFWSEWQAVIDSIENFSLPLSEYQSARRRLQLLKLELCGAEAGSAAAGLAVLDDRWRDMLDAPREEHSQWNEEAVTSKANALLNSALGTRGGVAEQLVAARIAYRQIRELCQGAGDKERGAVIRMMFPLSRHIHELEELCNS